MNEPFVEILRGDAATVLHTLPENLVQCIVTSPPYYKLRDYGVGGQLGTEDHTASYVQALVDVADALYPVLTPTGTFWLNIGDSYDARTGLRLLPAQVALALRDAGWYVRADVIWSKTRWMPNGGQTRPVMTHEYVFMLTKQNSGYYYNADALREPHSPVSLKRWAAAPVAALGGLESMGVKQATKEAVYRTKRIVPNPLGRLRPSVWSMCPSNYKGAHFAVMPEQLAEDCLLASSQPGDVVLDPFTGSGTTGKMAKKHGRSFIGIELNAVTARLAEANIG